MAILVVSVFPAPLSPLMTSPWSRSSKDMALYALEVVRKTWGSSSPELRSMPALVYLCTSLSEYRGTCILPKKSASGLCPHCRFGSYSAVLDCTGLE